MVHEPGQEQEGVGCRVSSASLVGEHSRTGVKDTKYAIIITSISIRPHTTCGFALGVPDAGPSDDARPEEAASADTQATNSETTTATSPPPEPLTLAKRIRAALANFPPITGSSGSTSNEAPTGDNTKASAAPPQVSDAGMISFLSSPAIMNGDGSKSGQSVWAALDRLRAVIPGQGSKQPQGVPLQLVVQPEGEDVLDDDESGVMVYGPLIPDENTQVELAESEIVPATPGEPEGEQSAQSTWKGKLEGVWPFGKGKAQEQATEPAIEESSTPSNSRVHVHSGKSKRVWVPSRDKISVQVMWWGYRMFVALLFYKVCMLTVTGLAICHLRCLRSSTISISKARSAPLCSPRLSSTCLIASRWS